MHKSGFVNILGRPNAGKSTLLNAILDEQMVIVSPKPQTTRHRILGILNDEDYQIVFSDTPGVIDAPAYKMQEAMSDFIYQTFEDADLILYLVTPFESLEDHEGMFEKISKIEVPKILLLNKVDLIDEERAEAQVSAFMATGIFDTCLRISAKDKAGIDPLRIAVLTSLPEGPEYYPKDQLSDRHERFFVTEIIREKILDQYRQEIPYSCEVSIEEYREGEGRDEDITHIRAIIYVSRKTQKPILIGKQGESIKQLGIASRESIEKFLDNRVHLELFVKVRENWRDDERSLKEFGYRG
jgi:GTP-binding protein Era